MTIQVINNSGGAETLGQMLRGFNDLLVNRNAAKQGQAQLDQQAAKMAAQQTQWDRDYGLSNQQLMEQRRRRGFDTERMERLELPGLAVDQRNAGTNAFNAQTNRGDLTHRQNVHNTIDLPRAQDVAELHDANMNLGRNFDPTLSTTPLSNLSVGGDNVPVDRSQAAVLASGLYNAQATPSYALPRQRVDTAKVGADTRKINAELADEEQNKISATNFLSTPLGKHFAGKNPGLVSPQALKEMWKDDNWHTYLARAQREFDDTGTIGDYDIHSARLESLKAGIPPGMSSQLHQLALDKYAEGVEAKKKMARYENMYNMASHPDFASGGGQMWADALGVVKGLIARHGRGVVSDEMWRDAFNTAAITERYDASRILSMIGMAKELYPVSDRDAKSLDVATGAHGATPKAIQYIMLDRHREQREIEAQAIKFGSMLNKARDAFRAGNSEAYSDIPIDMLPTEATEALEHPTGEYGSLQDGSEVMQVTDGVNKRWVPVQRVVQ